MVATIITKSGPSMRNELKTTADAMAHHSNPMDGRESRFTHGEKRRPQERCRLPSRHRWAPRWRSNTP